MKEMKLVACKAFKTFAPIKHWQFSKQKFIAVATFLCTFIICMRKLYANEYFKATNSTIKFMKMMNNCLKCLTG